ncbi:MAG: hypothetical protein OXG15_00445 [Gammaproteobacteria bacterium]|nr:hypothetical protein [Gammaproteobacteria bacterium]
MTELDIPQNLIEPFETAGKVLTAAFGLVVQDVARLGGGSVLAAYYQHRISTDLDFFAKLTPSEMASLFEKAEENLTRIQGVSEVTITSGFITFKVGETHVSLFTTPNLTGLEPESRDRLLGVELEPTPEILTKKARGRIMSNGVFAVRDFYDFCVVWKRDRSAYESFLTHVSKSDRDEILHELRHWRSSPLILGADKEPLINPIYPRLAERLWDYARELFAGNGIPDQAFLS